MFFSGAFPGGGFPGRGFPGGHGFGGDREEDDEDDLDTTAFYEALGVGKDSSQGDIRKAYLRISSSKDHPRRHPDKGGNAKMFAELQNAYECLSDPEKRARYDRGGESAANREGMSEADLFETLFGGGGGGGSAARRGPQQSEATSHPLRVTLEDCFTGKTCKVRITRTVVKRDPNGNLMDRQKNRYRKSSEQELLEVTLPRGARDKEKIVFRNKGDIQEGMLQGNVVLVVEVADHPFFQRKGADLILSRRVSLFEAITGVTFTIRGIDGELLEVSTPPGMVIKPEMMLELSGEGMPVAGHTQVKGSLFVKFTVDFPDQLQITPQMKKLLQGVIVCPPIPQQPAGVLTPHSSRLECKSRNLQPVNFEQVRQRESLIRGDADSEEEEEDEDAGHGGVQCAQQ